MKIEEFVELIRAKEIVENDELIEFDDDDEYGEFYNECEEGEEFRLIYSTGYTAKNVKTGQKYLVYGLTKVQMKPIWEEKNNYSPSQPMWYYQEEPDCEIVGYEKDEWTEIVKYYPDEIVEISDETYERINEEGFYMRKEVE